ncbi:MAG: hypothetical protein ABL894_14700, partial [Hyphomicrobium sp.]
MTTICDTAAWRIKKPVTFAVFAGLLALGLGGCETGSNLFGSSGGATPVAADQSLVPADGQMAKIAVAPLLGPPETVNKMFLSQLGGAIEKQRITVAKAPTDKSEYTLRGYIVSANEKGKTKVSYIWDLTDRTGKQVNRISGEELVASGTGKDPWSGVTPQVVDLISNKTASSIATWLPTQGQAAAVATTAPAAASAASPTPSAGNLQPLAATPAPVAAATPVAASGPTTGSIGRDGITTMVPSVTGAPGDGGNSLTTALQNELRKNGVALGNTPGAQTYKVEGKVSVGQGKDGKQPITIDWHVKDPTGKNIGTVSQKNEIPQGSVDGAWGQTATAAAEAAAKGIIKLLPPPTKVN